uniref:CAP-Gly domain-containing protein n=1 Tax=Neogobius melanostomus TaxID=47308 RepID=A0A8C6T4X0_9GOBI
MIQQQSLRLQDTTVPTPGTLRFKGPTSFANGFWAGVELDKSEGSNNGTYDGVLYFECAEQHGIFAPPDRITHLTDKFEMFIDTTEDDDSFNDDVSEDENEKHKTKQAKPQKQQCFGNEQIFSIKSESGDKITDDPVHLINALHQSNHHNSPIPNGKSFWDSGDMSPSPLIEDKTLMLINRSGLSHKESSLLFHE